jgi:hypothetical protein
VQNAVLGSCVSDFPHPCDQIPYRNNLWEGGFNLAHSFSVLDPWLLPCGEAEHHMAGADGLELCNSWQPGSRERRD